MATVTFSPDSIISPDFLTDTSYAIFCRFAAPTSVFGTITAAVLKCWVSARYSENSTSWSFSVNADWSADIAWSEASNMATLNGISFTNLSNNTRNYAGSTVNTLHSYDILGDGTKGIIKSYGDGAGFTIRLHRDAADYSAWSSTRANDPDLIHNTIKGGNDGLQYYDRTHGSTPVQIEITYTSGTPDTAKGPGGGGNQQYF